MLKLIDRFEAILNLLVLVAAIFMGPLLAHSDPPEFLPLTKGTYWIYRGMVTRSGHSPDGKFLVSNQAIIWRSEVMGGPYVPNAWVVRGLPMDLVWSGNNVEPQDHLIFQVGTNYYDLAGIVGQGKDDAYNQLLADIVQPNFSLDLHANEIDRAQILCEFPLAQGKRFGETGGSLVNSMRTDRYCWNVESVADFDPGKIKNFPPMQHPRVYEMAFRTAPDDSEMEIVPGIGIVGYHYHHHGTPMQVDVHLVEYHAAP